MTSLPLLKNRLTAVDFFAQFFSLPDVNSLRVTKSKYQSSSCLSTRVVRANAPAPLPTFPDDTKSAPKKCHFLFCENFLLRTLFNFD